MSLWTPDGERPVEPARTTPTPLAEDLSADKQEEAQQIASELQAVREQLGQVPAAVVIANHAMGLYELAAIHLSNQPPRLDEAQLAIDGFGALLGAIRGRLGDDESTLEDALAQIRLAFVQIKASTDQAAAAGDGAGPTSSDGAAPSGAVDD